MSNSNRFLVGGAALVIWASAVIAPYWFPSDGYAANPSSEEEESEAVTDTPSNPGPVVGQGGAGSSTKTLVEIVGPNVPRSYTSTYTVPAGHRLILTDIIFNSCGLTDIYQNGTVVSQIDSNPTTMPMRRTQTGIEFGEGHIVGVGKKDAGPALFELRGYLEPL